MARLGVNIDHIATIRQARGGTEPDPVAAAALAELAGADGITIHLREDRRHIQDRDLKLLRQTVQTRLNLEMAATAEMVNIALTVRPEMCTLVPEKRQELTTEGGLEVRLNMDAIADAVRKLQDGGIAVSLFIDPDPDQVKAADKVGADCIEIHTGSYADAEDLNRQACRQARPGDKRRSWPELCEHQKDCLIGGDRGIQHRTFHHFSGGACRARPCGAGHGGVDTLCVTSGCNARRDCSCMLVNGG